ncbi:MAG: TSUP family transporter [Pseudomonadales bacterium]|jgi:uncharacterized membrane protein YfcA|nr:TSUP family transporter [Pseudomonadales bacterium]HJN50201.1 TSUP family transporter [Pseudomonadales bacterium]|tara:strand:- start:495 stop:1232 length:738 start_codon:yes stop_codon:yes gene_type:complete
MYVVLIIAALLTSFISGVLSMAGGMILMGIFGLFLSVPAAMVLHGVTQTASNGSRIWLYRHDIRWSVLFPYAAGAAICLAIFTAFAFVPSKGLLFILIGCFPFLAIRLPRFIKLDMERTPVSLTCGFIVTLAQLLAGASGPILDIFYNTSRLTRFEILGTKAITQTLGHIIKLVYYAFFISLAVDIPMYVYPLVVVAAITGNSLGKLVLERISDVQFRTTGQYVIMVIGVFYIGKGIYELVIPLV